MDWKDKRVFLTGASSGIGEGMALALAKRGAVLGLVARREELLTELAANCEAAGGKARSFALDVVDPAALQTAAVNFVKEFGHVDVLIANAGMGGNDEATRSYEPAAVKRLIEVNLLGAVNAVHAVLPGM